MIDFNTTNIIYRHFEKQDLFQISEIEKASINPPWSYKAICEFSECETSRILVACYEGLILGYITYSIVLDEVQIANIAVCEKYRRNGIANNLLKTLYANSKSIGMNLITLEVRDSNIAARTLYKRCGYIEVGRRKNYYKSPDEDAILMNLNL